MEDSLSSAYTYIFKNKNWLLRLIILSMLNIPIIVLLLLYDAKKLNYHSTEFYLLLITTIITMLINMGYYARCTRNLIYLDPNNQNIMPQWKSYIFEYLDLGIKKAWFYFISGFMMFPMMFTFERLMLPRVGFDFALEGLFCTDFNYKNPDFKSMLDGISDNKELYYKMAFTNSVLPLCLIALIFAGHYKVTYIRTEYIILLSSFFLSYYFLIQSYFSAVSAKYMS